MNLGKTLLTAIFLGVCKFCTYQGFLKFTFFENVLDVTTDIGPFSSKKHSHLFYTQPHCLILQIDIKLGFFVRCCVIILNLLDLGFVSEHLTSDDTCFLVKKNEFSLFLIAESKKVRIFAVLILFKMCPIWDS